MSDIDIALVDSLKALDPEWPIREADMVYNFCSRDAVPEVLRNRKSSTN